MRTLNKRRTVEEKACSNATTTSLHLTSIIFITISPLERFDTRVRVRVRVRVSNDDPGPWEDVRSARFGLNDEVSSTRTTNIL